MRHWGDVVFVRYDDMIDTVLRAGTANPNQRAIVWSQLSDLLAQKGSEISQSYVTAALTRLSELKPLVPVAHRTGAARAIARRCHFVPLVAFYGGDTAPVAQALLSDVQLTDEEWLTFIPLTTPLARMILRERRDLGANVTRALHAFGAIDFRLADQGAAQGTNQSANQSAYQGTSEERAAPVKAQDAVLQGTQISELVRRIEEYRADRLPQTLGAEPLDTPFRFETGADGLINWTNSLFRGAVIGLSIAEPAFDGESGTDAYSAGAFRQRATIERARLYLEDSSRLGGDWRFDATPYFDQRTGQFLGYKANARRPRPGETAKPLGTDKILGSVTFGESMRQLVHELRTPLNAISGFAQMIDGQMFGPVPQRYRSMADEIIVDSDRLMGIFADLDLAARLDSDSFKQDSGQVAIDRLIDDLADELDHVSDQRDVRLRVHLPEHLPPADVDPHQARRLVARFLSALVEVGGPGETINGTIMATGADIRFAVDRPTSLIGVDTPTLLDPGYSPEGDAPDAAMLSLGFSLRLVINFAKAVGGRLDISDKMLTLTLPAVSQARRDTRTP